MTETMKNAKETASFPPELLRMLETGLVRGRTRTLPVVGASTRNNLAVLAAMLDYFAPQRTMEIGLGCGTSALLFLNWHQRHSATGEALHTALDPYQADLDHAGLEQIERAGFSGRFRHIPRLSHAALPQLVVEGERFQLIYVDGSHLFEDVFIDLYYSARLLAEGGVILFDDATWPDVAKALAFIRKNMASSLQEIDLEPFRPQGYRGVRYKLAKALGKTQLVAFRRVADPARPWDARFWNF